MPVASLRPTDDVYVEQENPDTNFEANNYIWVGFNLFTANIDRGWLKFDISSVPAGSTINSATLTMGTFYQAPVYAGPDYIEIARSTDVSWDEATITWNNAPNGSVAGTPIATILQVFNDLVGVPGQGVHAVDVAADIVAALASGKIAWRLKSQGESHDTGGLNMEDYDYVPTPPYPLLVIDYTPPVPPPTGGGAINQQLRVGK